MKLRLKGLSLLIVEPPSGQDSLTVGDTVWTTGSVTSEQMLPNLEVYRQNAPAGSFFYSFFLADRSAFVHLAATEAELERA